MSWLSKKKRQTSEGEVRNTRYELWQKGEETRIKMNTRKRTRMKPRDVSVRGGRRGCRRREAKKKEKMNRKSKGCERGEGEGRDYE